jgi:hypothetical protein
MLRSSTLSALITVAALGIFSIAAEAAPAARLSPDGGATLINVRGGGGGGHGGGGGMHFGGGGAHFDGGHFGGGHGFHGGRFAFAPYFGGYYDDYAYGSDCWYSRARHRWVCPAY